MLARSLVQAGHRARVVGVYPRTYPGAPYDEVDGVSIWRFRASTARWGWVAARYHLFRTIARWATGGEVDVVEVPDWEGWAAGWPRLPVPVIARLNGSATYFGAELGRSVDGVLTRLERASLRRADFWCSCSRYTADRTRDLLRLRTEPSAILYNFIPTHDSVPHVERSRRSVVFTGTLAEKKGVVSLIRAWPRVVDACGDAQLHLYGKDGRTGGGGGSMRAYLASQLHGRAAASVHFHGHVGREEISGALQRARAAVFPSYAEAFAVAPLEAMAAGCATIYTGRGSGPELIVDGRDGLLVDPDRPEEIAHAITRLLTDDRLAQTLGAAGRGRVDAEFSTRTVMARNEAYYRECVARFRRWREPAYA